MVKIAVAGGSGHIASEVIDVLAATHKHEILILSRKDPSTTESLPGVTWAKTDYTDKAQLTSILNGVHTVLCFSSAHTDHGSAAQKLLIDAAVAAGVKRFAPNEWSSASIEELPWYAEKVNVRAYLEELNKEKKVLEYTLFQPGLLLDYCAPAGTCKHLEPFELWIDFPNRRAITLEGNVGEFTATTMKDLAHVVAGAVEYSGEWPVIGGVYGMTLSMSKLLEIGVKARGGKPWDITTLKEDDVRLGKVDSPWVPKFNDPALTPEQNEQFSKIIVRGSLLSGVSKSWVVSDEWNRLLPDYKFADVEEFLVKHWAGRP
ncbi:hypothetical protein G7Y89_g9329 [Cudoniella acicularis]|uniref:NmrA-like domain-containing protein n=1 Tax=Cudoniella acicularis TaxID=354080 RepID=A0A8H4W2Q0_9HELO|nr:hypothetical protein G7Y89_g9329 [Cudoniella acicularis]